MAELFHDAETWVAISFVIFVLIAFRPAKAAILGKLDQKIAGIRAEIEEAQKLREEAQAALAGYQRRQREALQEAEKIIAHAREEAARAKIRAESDLAEMIKRREIQASEKIAQAEAAALAEIRNRAVEMAIDAASRILSEKMAGKAGADAISAAIEALPEKLH